MLHNIALSMRAMFDAHGDFAGRCSVWTRDIECAETVLTKVHSKTHMYEYNTCVNGVRIHCAFCWGERNATRAHLVRGLRSGAQSQKHYKCCWGAFVLGGVGLGHAHSDPWT